MAHTEGPVRVEQQGAPSNARRKLVRGAFALPAVVTVHSGSALAQSSSLRCLANGPTGPSAPEVIYFGANPPVTYLRIPLAVAYDGVGGSASSYLYYVAGADVYAAATARRVSVLSTLISSTGFRPFSVSGNMLTGAEMTQAQVETDPYRLQVRENLNNDQRPFAALIFSADGNQIVGVGITQLTGVNAATESCWTSFDKIV